VILGGCKPEGLAGLALTSCDFIDDLSRVTVNHQIPPQPAKRPVHLASSTAAEKPDDSTMPAPEKPLTEGSSEGVVESGGSSGVVEGSVGIAGAGCLKVHVTAV